MGGGGKGGGKRGGDDYGDGVDVGVGDSDNEQGFARRGGVPSQARPPPFHGGPNLDPGDYRDWRREVAALKASYKVRDEDYGGLVFLATKGDARNVLWEITPEDFTKYFSSCSTNLVPQAKAAQDAEG